jgi:hypothetical protein
VSGPYRDYWRRNPLLLPVEERKRKSLEIWQSILVILVRSTLGETTSAEPNLLRFYTA